MPTQITTNQKNMLTYNEVPAGITEILQRMDDIENSLNRLLGTQKSNHRDEYITRQEAANILHITLPTLHQRTLNGSVQGYRTGRRVLYKKSEVEHAVTAISINKKTR